MNTTATVTVPASPERVFPLVDDLSRYPEWLPLVHTAQADTAAADGVAAWHVELRAAVGPLARSKALRMVRTAHDSPTAVSFARHEPDREHAAWQLDVELEPVADTSDQATKTQVTMHLAYGGSLWADAALEPLLRSHITKAQQGLIALVS